MKSCRDIHYKPTSYWNRLQTNMVLSVLSKETNGQKTHKTKQRKPRKEKTQLSIAKFENGATINRSKVVEMTKKPARIPYGWNDEDAQSPPVLLASLAFSKKALKVFWVIIVVPDVKSVHEQPGKLSDCGMAKVNAYVWVG